MAIGDEDERARSTFHRNDAENGSQTLGKSSPNHEFAGPEDGHVYGVMIAVSAWTVQTAGPQGKTIYQQTTVRHDHA